MSEAEKPAQPSENTAPAVIAIDGPAASGKSTLGLKLAAALNYLFFDTGVMYRAITWAVLQRGTPLDDPEALSRLAEAVEIDVLPASEADGRSSDVLLDGEDVTWEIRSPEVDANVSAVSATPGVRRALLEKQRRIGMRGRVVMVGRDIGTVVIPEAGLKLYLDASVEERARRRFMEQVQRGESAEYAQILEAMTERDRYDSSRPIAPLRAADDAIILKSDDLGAEDVLAQVLEIIAARFGRG